MEKKICDRDPIDVDDFEEGSISKEYCGTCETCENPGHIRHYPSSVPYTGSWCDSCFAKLERKEKIKMNSIMVVVVVLIVVLISYQFMG